MSDKRKRAWVFTLNNPTIRLSEFVETMKTDTRIQYGKVALEVGGEKNTPHFQGYVVFRQSQRFSSLKKLLPSAHIEPRYGTHEEAAAYVGDTEKSGTVKAVEEWGKAPVGKGKPGGTIHEQLIDAKEAIDNGATLSDVWNTHFPVMVRYSYGIGKYYESKERKYPRNKSGHENTSEGEK